MKRNVLTVCGALAFLALLAYGASAGVNPGAQASAPQIEGTWLLTVTPPSESGRQSFKVLISFARGGVFLASAEAGPQGLPAQKGAWSKVGSNEYVSTALSFGTGATPADVFTFKVRSLFRVIGEDELEGAGELATCDASGNNCQSLPGCSSLHALRVKAEPPSCPE